MNPEEYLFPHKHIRPIQEDLVSAVDKSISEGRNLVVHAPTGLGKTAASLSPAIRHALEKKKTIFFVTSRHTQHTIAIDTIKAIKERYHLSLVAVDMLGKTAMCSQHTTKVLDTLGQADDKKNRCDFYDSTRSKQGLTPKAHALYEKFLKHSPTHAESIIEECTKQKVCPYEISIELAKHANVIVADYYYVFHPHVSTVFFSKIKKELGECIIIVDEGHNLPARLRNLYTHTLNTPLLERAHKEAMDHKQQEVLSLIAALQSVLERLTPREQERHLTKEELVAAINNEAEYDSLVEEFTKAGDEVLKDAETSALGQIAQFLEAWLGPDKAFSRVVKKEEYKKQRVAIKYTCLDPSLASTVVFEHAFSSILMSGTLIPTQMYRNVLGFPEKTTELELPSPFPHENKVTLIVPQTTTKFSARDDNQYTLMAKICAGISETVPGNSAFFFPSYPLMDEVYKRMVSLVDKRIIKEIQGLSKEGRSDLLEEFKSRHKEGAILFGVASGSFGEGIDLPGDLLKAVTIVGIPLQRPDLETQDVIAYYDQKFGNGADYAYIYPAIITALQNAGRCIRSETDRGVIVFLDERYAWPTYKKCFPKDMRSIITKDPIPSIREFFGRI